jgi:hypothetical protein
VPTVIKSGSLNLLEPPEPVQACNGISLSVMNLIATYSTVRVGKHLFDMFPLRDVLKQGDVLSPLLFNFATRLQTTIRKEQVKQDGLRLNSTHLVLV